MRTYTKADGSQFYGLLGKPTTVQTREAFYQPRMVLVTPPNGNVQPGDVFIGASGRKMIVLDNAVEESVGLTQDCFYVVLLNTTVSWERPKVKEDAVTLMVSSDGFEDLGTFDCSMIYEKYEESLVFKVETPIYQIITDKELKLNDIINKTLTVKKVQKQLGVTIAYVQ